MQFFFLLKSAGKDFGRDDIPLLKQKSSEVSTVIVQESGDLGSTVVSHMFNLFQII